MPRDLLHLLMPPPKGSPTPAQLCSATLHLRRHPVYVSDQLFRHLLSITGLLSVIFTNGKTGPEKCCDFAPVLELLRDRVKTRTQAS